jgi:holo-[acyl-carrier protein] synthase
MNNPLILETMLVDIGNDIVLVTNIEKSIKRSVRFLNRVFCPLEQAYCEQKPNKYEHYAGFFAIKESVMKALGTGWSKGVQWNQIEVGHYPSGKPVVTLYKQAKKQAELRQIDTIHVSVSHTEQYANACVICECIN